MVEEDGKTEREGEEHGAAAVGVAGTAATAAGLRGGGIWLWRFEMEEGFGGYGGLEGWGRKEERRMEGGGLQGRRKKN
ncbi:uncharacterized protein G2W53_044533 [Senna tora]|nr:uncharacterized protein G2W53_044533 [Senna tora]